ncbi:restriction modification system DNA specificity domain [Prosthecochloris aestuarii DSM 271]|uniref:Restriction modification system DNA specificity domain n=1 Tax=Prosthecochloris aestuarii (strain DSM 271 / SK 413) TaxID=290512 RepID=B4S4B7_PROA2|nr:restriction endonuclease subunit S [Prosthecochloris aestuarii]ACF45365.1 restriction modification system DNA specificity domain [Prosthecochloris aestuarii DSM 271]
MSNFQRGADIPVRHSEGNGYPEYNGGLENPPSVERDSESGRDMRDWKKTTVGKVSTGFLSGGTPSTSRADYWKGEIPWITSKWLGDKLELTTGEKFVSEEAIKNTATKIVPKDSIIFATRVGVGKVGINRIDLAINQDLAGVLIDNENYDIKFLAYQLGIDSIQQYVAMNKRGATIKGITRDCLEQIQLNIPPLPEQKKIAHILSTVQRAIEAQERIIQTTTELKKALMHKLFTEGLRNEPQKETEIGLVPESWEVCKVGDVAKIQSGGTPSRDVPENWRDGTIPWVKTGEINYCVIKDTEEKITPTGLANSAAQLFPTGTLLMAMYGQGITRGKVGLLGIEAATNQACASIIPIDQDQISSVFLYYFFEFQYENLRQLGHGANQRNMSAGLIRGFPLSFPKFEEQAAMIAAFESLDKKRYFHERKRTQFQGLFRTLLHELMNAKTRVHQLNSPAA